MFSYSTIVARYASDYGVPAGLAHAVIRAESNYRPKSRGRAGEIGLMQIKVGTARMVGYSGSARELFDPETNIKYGIKYLSMAYRLSGGDTCGTILRYNAGHGAKRMNRVSAALCAKVKRAQAEHDELVAQYVRVLNAVRGLLPSLAS
jgi:soluble lytic murein transglycosylase-like protein